MESITSMLCKNMKWLSYLLSCFYKISSQRLWKRHTLVSGTKHIKKKRSKKQGLGMIWFNICKCWHYSTPRISFLEDTKIGTKIKILCLSLKCNFLLHLLKKKFRSAITSLVIKIAWHKNLLLKTQKRLSNVSHS